MGSSKSASHTGTTAKKTLRWRRLAVVLVLVTGLWLFSDWIFLGTGHSEAVSAPAVVVESSDIEPNASHGKYRHLIVYHFPSELIEGLLPEYDRGRGAAMRADGSAAPGRNMTKSSTRVLLDNRIEQGETILVEYIAREPWRLHRVNGELQDSQGHQRYLPVVAFLVAIAVLAIAVFAGRRR